MKPLHTWLSHFAIWLFFYLFILDYYLEESFDELVFLIAAIEIGCYALVAYLNYFILLPTFFASKQWLKYAGSLLFVLIGVVVLFKYSGGTDWFYEGTGWRYDLSTLLNSSLFLFISTLFWSYEQWQQTLREQVELENRQLQTELQLLKTQINPHFLFNTLNNIYSLSYQKDERAAPMIGKLAQLMRYLLDEGALHRVALTKEVTQLSNYIALQQLKNIPSNNIDFYTEGIQEHHQIAPLLLITFVENAFKHSNIFISPEAWINIAIVVEDGQFQFSISNSKKARRAVNQTTQSGIGLNNAKRQLALHYPKQHQLMIEEGEGQFKVELKIRYSTFHKISN